jgi:hypothetical protein
LAQDAHGANRGGPAPFAAIRDDGAPLSPIEATDAWARYVWHCKRTSPAVLIALPLWLAIRIFYRIAHTISSITHTVSRPIAWLYWRLYELCGAPARLLKAIYWAAIYPVVERIMGAGKWLFWRAYAFFGPTARALKAFYWRVLFPPLSAAARVLGFRLLAGAPAVKRPPETPSAHARLRAAFAAGLDEADIVAWTADDLADFEPLFDCLPRFGLTRPAPAGLHILLSPSLCEAGTEQLRLLGLRLRSGSPFRRVHFYAADSASASALSEALAAAVTVLAGCDEREFAQLARDRLLDAAPSLEIAKFGPVVLLISALWGRVGSTLIFDAQTRFLIESGAIVARVFIDHNPGHGHDRAARRHQLVHENLLATWPHLTTVAERNESAQDRARLHAQTDYKQRSGVRRFELELESARPLDAGLLKWAGAAAQLTIVNHAPHMAFAERVSRAPIVLETHDILTHQLESHGWPKFVSLKDEPAALRDADQQDIWRRANVCVDLSPDDHAEISRYARAAVFIRPTAEAAAPRLRDWREVVRRNALAPDFAASDEIDVLLWGDWHEGNVRAVEWFFNNVRPTDARLAAARIAIVGRVTKLLPQQILHAPNVVTAGFVDSIADFIGRAKVLAIADQDGSGVSVKAIEAIRYARPFVATPRGLRGLAIGGIDMQASAAPKTFAADLAALLDHPAKRDARARIAEEIYARNISHDAYEAGWRAIIANAAPAFGTGAPAAAPAATDGPALQISEMPAAAALPAPALARAEAPALRRRTLATHVLAAVVCTYNRYDLLTGAVDSLLAQDIPDGDLEIIVVDNSPDQEAAARFGARYDGTRVRYVLEPVAGLSNARNVGAEACNARYVAYIDDDAVAAPDWARNLAAGFQKFMPDAGIAGGRIVPRWITPRPDWLPDELIGNLSIVDWGGAARPLGKMEWIAGCNIAFDRATLLELGGFSRALGRVGAGVALLSNEESAMIEKFADIGRHAIYVPEATVEHLIEPARLSQEWFRRRAAWQAVSDYIKDPKKASSYAGAAAERLRRELVSEQALPPGFVQPDAEREQFRRDVGLMYDIVIAMLAGGVEFDENGKSSASLQDKLLASVRREMQRNPQLRSTIRKIANI